MSINMNRAAETAPAEPRDGLKRITRTRNALRNLAFPVTLAACVAMPLGDAAIKSQHKQAVKDATKPTPNGMLGAQSDASLLAFGGKDAVKKADAKGSIIKGLVNDRNHRKTGSWQLPVNDLIAPSLDEEVEINPDRKSIHFDGVDYSFTTSDNKDGDTFVWAGQTMLDENIGQDQLHMIAPVLVGYAEQQEGLSEEEINQLAMLNTRQNLARNLEKPTEQEVGLGKDEQVLVGGL